MGPSVWPSGGLGFRDLVVLGLKQDSLYSSHEAATAACRIRSTLFCIEGPSAVV